MSYSATGPSANNDRVSQTSNMDNMELTFPSATTLAGGRNFSILGSQTGTVGGNFTNNAATQVTFDPTGAFKPGETVTVLVAGRS